MPVTSDGKHTFRIKLAEDAWQDFEDMRLDKEQILKMYGGNGDEFGKKPITVFDAYELRHGSKSFYSQEDLFPRPHSVKYRYQIIFVNRRTVTLKKYKDSDISEFEFEFLRYDKIHKITKIAKIVKTVSYHINSI